MIWSVLFLFDFTWVCLFDTHSNVSISDSTFLVWNHPVNSNADDAIFPKNVVHIYFISQLAYYSCSQVPNNFLECFHCIFESVIPRTFLYRNIQLVTMWKKRVTYDIRGIMLRDIMSFYFTCMQQKIALQMGLPEKMIIKVKCETDLIQGGFFHWYPPQSSKGQIT